MGSGFQPGLGVSIITCCLATIVIVIVALWGNRIRTWCRLGVVIRSGLPIIFICWWAVGEIIWWVSISLRTVGFLTGRIVCGLA